MPKPHTGSSPGKVDSAGAEVLRRLVAERDDRTLAELTTLYGTRTGIAVSIHTIRLACNRLDLAVKLREAVKGMTLGREERER